MRGKRLFAFIDSCEASPPVDNLADVPGRERLVEFERAVIDGRLEDESVVAVTVEVLRERSES
jgi:hypothetical protein